MKVRWIAPCSEKPLTASVTQGMGDELWGWGVVELDAWG